MRTDPDFPGAVPLGEGPYFQEVLSGNAPHGDFETHVIQPRLPLSKDAGMIVLTRFAEIGAGRSQRTLEPRFKLRAKARFAPVVN